MVIKARTVMVIKSIFLVGHMNKISVGPSCGNLIVTYFGMIK